MRHHKIGKRHGIVDALSKTMTETISTHGGRTSATCFSIFRTICPDFARVCRKSRIIKLQESHLSTMVGGFSTCSEQVIHRFCLLSTTCSQLIHRFWPLTHNISTDFWCYPQVIHRIPTLWVGSVIHRLSTGFTLRLTLRFTLSKRYQTFFCVCPFCPGFERKNVRPPW
jgi:hypothetical protein